MIEESQSRKYSSSQRDLRATTTLLDFVEPYFNNRYAIIFSHDELKVQLFRNNGHKMFPVRTVITLVQAGPNLSRVGLSNSEMSWQLQGQTLSKRNRTEPMKSSSSVRE